jgi:hypothetical protein
VAEDYGTCEGQHTSWYGRTGRNGPYPYLEEVLLGGSQSTIKCTIWHCKLQADENLRKRIDPNKNLQQYFERIMENFLASYLTTRLIETDHNLPRKELLEERIRKGT